MLRVVIVGSGPAGVYAAAALSDSGEATVDVIDKLPSPFGLVRYGVAPDHPRIRSISAALAKALQDPAVRFLGNVELGADLTLTELHQHYDAVLIAAGAAMDRRLDIPGEDLPGSISATDFVAWYTGHPDADPDGISLQADTAVVIGAGNVALDVARLLARSATELRATDIPDHVLAAFEQSTVRDIHLVARRGPVQARFTTKELREIGALDNADILIDPADLELDEASRQARDSQPMLRRNIEAMQAWAQRPPSGRPRRVHLHFWQRPVEVLGTDRVTGLRVERTRLDETGQARGTGQFAVIEAQLVFRSVGYRGLPLPDLPFDEADGVIPNADGRVLRDGIVVPGEYVAGWIKRGPTGVIGTNKSDANQTVAALLADAPSLPPAPTREPDAILELLRGRGTDVVTWQGWEGIERAEEELGQRSGRDRVRIADREALLRAALASRRS